MFKFKKLPTKINIEDKWLEDIEKLPYLPCHDYDLINAIKSCAIKSASGDIKDLYKSSITDDPINYKFTSLIKIKSIKELIKNIPYFETTRIRIFRQEPKHTTPMHIDKDEKDIIRMWVGLNEDDDFKFYFGKHKEEVLLKSGEILFFNPNYLHGAANLSNKNRYTLNVCGKVNKCLTKTYLKNQMIT